MARKKRKAGTAFKLPAPMRRRLNKFIWALALAGLLAAGHWLEERWPGAWPWSDISAFSRQEGQVLKVSDGDSLIVADGQGQRVKVRLYGVDAPELDQPHGRASRDYLAALTLRKVVRLERHGQDQYGRLLARVFLEDGRPLDELLVNSGQAWVYEQYCDELWCFKRKADQHEARRRGLGLWQEAEPTPPWIWRRDLKR